MRATRALSGGGIGYLLAGQSGCREQPISAQGRLERVLQAGTQSLPWHGPIREQGSLLQLADLEKTAGADFHAFATFVALIERQGEIHPLADFFQLGETARGAVHGALFASEA
jgi:hypothetical protein